VDVTILPQPEAPGPAPGQPGHFEHHDWLAASVRAMAEWFALPGAQARSHLPGNPNPDITATSWAPLPTTRCFVTLGGPLPVGTRVLVTFHAWLIATTTAGDVRAAIQCSGGATLAAGSPVGHTLYKLGSAASPWLGTEQGGMSQLVTITDDTQPLTVELFAQQAGRAAANQRAVNYPGLVVSPQFWHG
jgi:hypothetical protein